jgi:hypothetical protein
MFELIPGWTCILFFFSREREEGVEVSMYLYIIERNEKLIAVQYDTSSVAL